MIYVVRMLCLTVSCWFQNNSLSLQQILHSHLQVRIHQVSSTSLESLCLTTGGKRRRKTYAGRMDGGTISWGDNCVEEIEFWGSAREAALPPLFELYGMNLFNYQRNDIPNCGRYEKSRPKRSFGCNEDPLSANPVNLASFLGTTASVMKRWVRRIRLAAFHVNDLKITDGYPYPSLLARNDFKLSLISVISNGKSSEEWRRVEICADTCTMACQQLKAPKKV